jgi:ABC-type uncharacterized transport system auxiliary subunit
MRTRHGTLLIIIVAIATIFSGCAGKVKYPTHYTLHVPEPPDPAPGPGAHASVAVREFRSPAYLRQGPVVYRVSPDQIGFYDYHRWATDPREFVTNAIAERLRASGKFAEVRLYDGRSRTDYILSGHLEKLEEIDYDGGVKVEVALSAQMTDLRTGTAVWSNSASDIGAVPQRTVPAVVAEMSRTMDRAIEKLLSPVTASPPATGR